MIGRPNSCSRFACLAALLALGASAALADPRAATGNCSREDVESADPIAAASDRNSAEASTAIIAEAVRPLPPAPARTFEQPVPRRAWTARFVDSFDVGARLKALSRLRILRLWDSSRVTVFFGLDHSGHAGLHIQQQDPHDLPPMRLKNVPFDLPPLRAVPLGSM